MLMMQPWERLQPRLGDGYIDKHLIAARMPFLRRIAKMSFATPSEPTLTVALNSLSKDWSACCPVSLEQPAAGTVSDKGEPGTLWVTWDSPERNRATDTSVKEGSR